MYGSGSDILAGANSFLSWFNNLSIRVKLLGSFAAAIALMAIATVFAIRALNSAAAANDDLFQTHFRGLVILDEAKQEFLLSNVNTMDALLADDTNEAKGIVADAEEHQKVARERLEAFVATQTDNEITDTVGQALTGTDLLIDIRKGVFSSIVAGDLDGAIEANENGLRGKPSGDKTAEGVVDLLNQVTERSHTLATESRASSSSASSAATRNSVIIAIVAALAGLGVAYYIAHQVRESVGQVVSRLVSIESKDVTFLEKGIRAIANGDLSVDVQPATSKIAKYNNDEVGKASATINSMLDKLVSTIATYNEARHSLSDIVSEVRYGAGSLVNSSEMLKDSSDQMASATGQIATAINEVTRSAVSLSGLSQDSAREVEQVASGSQQLAAAAKANAQSAGDSKTEATNMSERIQYVANASEMVAASPKSRATPPSRARKRSPGPSPPWTPSPRSWTALQRPSVNSANSASRSATS